MSTNEREKLLSFLFDRNDKKIIDIRLFRGNAENFSVETMCRIAREVIEDTWAAEGVWIDSPPLTPMSPMKDAEMNSDEELQARYRAMSTKLIPPRGYQQPLASEPPARSDLRSLIATTLLYSAAIVAVVALMVVAIIVGVVMG